MFVVNSLPVAIIFCVITMLGWGSWANTQKLAGKEKWPFQLFYWDYAIGVFLFSLVFSHTLGSFGTALVSARPDKVAQARRINPIIACQRKIICRRRRCIRRQNRRNQAARLNTACQLPDIFWLPPGAFRPCRPPANGFGLGRRGSRPYHGKDAFHRVPLFIPLSPMLFVQTARA